MNQVNLRARAGLLSLCAAVSLGGCAPARSGAAQFTAVAAAASEPTPAFSTPYQAVLLSNGQAFFGKLEGYGTRHPVLRDVDHVRTVPSERAGAPATSALIRRGKEWHAPNVMYLNPDHIVLVESVTPGSKVAELIALEGGTVKADSPAGGPPR